MLRVVLLVLPGLLSAQLDRTISLYCPGQSLSRSTVHTSFKNVLYSVSGSEKAELQWKFEAPGRIAAHVTADWLYAPPNGLVYVTAYSSMDDKERPSPMLFALDAGNGTEKWKMELPSGDCDGLCLPRDALFATFEGEALVQVFGDWYRRNGTLLSIDVAGKIQWKFMTNGDPIQRVSAGYGDELLVGGLKEGSLHLLDSSKGTVKWTMDFSGGIVRTPGPNARYMDESGTVVALASSSDRGPSYPQVSYILVIDHDGTIRSNISTTLSFACASNFKNPVIGYGNNGQDRSIYVNGVNAGDHDPCALRAFSYDGEVLMTRPGMVSDEWLAPNTYYLARAEYGHKGDILYTGSSHTKPHTSGDMINTITALNGADGSVRWKANLSDSTMYRGMNHQIVAVDETLLVWNDWTTGDLSANKVYAIHKGKEVWSLTTGDMLPPVVDTCVASSSTLITYIASSTCHPCGKPGSNPSLKLFALDQKGTVIWTFAPKPNETLIV